MGGEVSPEQMLKAWHWWGLNQKAECLYCQYIKMRTSEFWEDKAELETNRSGRVAQKEWMTKKKSGEDI